MYLQRYSGEHLCGAHLMRSVERRVTRELARHDIPRDGLVLVAVSGGKDSIAALRLVHRYFTPPGIRVEALTIDEGIAGYRPEGIAVAARACAELGVPHRVARYEDAFGTGMDAAVPRITEGAPCGPCGVFRRTLLNRAAREAGASFLVTGHNLDDMAQSVLMNVLRGDMQRLARLSGHDATQEGFVPRLLPLRAVPEREVALYAHLQGWEVHRAECPYAHLAHRGTVRDALLQLEDANPGTRQGLLATLDKAGPALRASGVQEKDLRTCPECGEPTSGARCQACAMAARVQGR